MPTEDAYSSGHLVLSHSGFENVPLLRPLTQSYITTPIHDAFPDLTPFLDLTPPIHDPFPDLTSYWNWHYWIWVSMGHLQRVWHAARGRLLLVLSHFGTCMCSNVETNLSWTCLVSGPLNFEHPSVLLFCLEKREEIWLSPMTKAPTPTEMSKGQSDNTNNATKKFHTSIFLEMNLSY